TFAVPVDAPGVTSVDDWDGFGQRLSAAGTSVFEGVPVDPAVVSAYKDAPLSHIQAFYQLYLLAVLAGIGQAVS
ncbi:acyl-CoA dehydrogenase, partial [Bacillus sp. S34]|nr:acyl-CoA dehydrogenase [Bacillus sp. S34]